MKQILKQWATLAALAVASIGPAAAQFSSGSTGADGALNLTTAGTVDFDPAVLGLNAAGDNIFNFTTINIGAGVTVRLRGTRLREKPVVWLASGAVTIAGTIDLSGADGAAMSAATPGVTRAPAEPGPGGFSGGMGSNGSSPATNGFGPGGGGASDANGAGSGGGYATSGSGAGFRSNTYGSVQLVPLVGGSGGGGGSGGPGGNGGGGAGALRVISSVSISVTGSILAKGGVGGDSPTSAFGKGGCGSGGAIHLIAPTISGVGSLDASGGVRSGVNPGGFGRILLSSSALSFTGTSMPAANTSRVFLPANPTGVPSVRVTSINGIATPANPAGDRFVPDVTISSAAAVMVAIAASNVPIGTVVKLTLTPENGADQSASCLPLAGTVASSTATCTIAFPSGVSITSARATW
jgi:hypothetical protein